MKTKRFMRILSLLTCLCLIFLLASCSSEPKTELAQFKTEEGIYQHPDIPWHSTIEEVEAITGWNVKDNFVGRTPDDVDFPESLYTLQDIPFDGQNCAVELQFDRNDELWAISIYIPGQSGDLKKQFKSFEKELTKAFGKPDAAKHDAVSEGSDIVQDRAIWRVWDENGKLVNTFFLEYANKPDAKEGYLVAATSWKDEGFRVIE